MKNIIILISLSLFVVGLQAQALTVNVTAGECSGYDLELDGNILDRLSTCDFEATQNTGGTTQLLSFTNVDMSLGLSGISTLDLVNIRRGLFFGFDNNLHIIASDYDLDGAVSTYDLVSMRSTILGITTGEVNLSIVPSNIMSVDPFDIAIDYSTLEVTQDDFANGVLDISVVKAGNLDF